MIKTFIMKVTKQSQDNKVLSLWPYAGIILLTVGVVFVTRNIISIGTKKPQESKQTSVINTNNSIQASQLREVLYSNLINAMRESSHTSRDSDYIDGSTNTLKKT